MLTLLRVKIKGCVAGGVMASDSEPGKFFSFNPPQTTPGIKISTPTDPLENIQKRSK